MRLLWSQCWSNPSKEATTWQLSLFEDPFCPLPVIEMYKQQTEKVTINCTVAVNLLLHTSLYKICWPFYCFSMFSKGTTHTLALTLFYQLSMQVYTSCVSHSTGCYHYYDCYYCSFGLWVSFLGIQVQDDFHQAGWECWACQYSRFLSVSWSSVQSPDDFKQAETSSWAGSAYSKYQPALPNCTFQSARLKQRSLKCDLKFVPK